MIPEIVTIVDSHTGGEPTRTVISGGPDLGSGTMAARLAHFRNHHDDFRSAVVNEPRGSDVLVGALLCEPLNPGNACGVIFFNNVGMLGMCGHGTIGLAVTLRHLGRIGPGRHRIETPVGDITCELLDAHRVHIENVPSYRFRKAVPVSVPGFGTIHGDIAWGGNWFFLVGHHPVKISVTNIESLTDFAWRIRQALSSQGITGEGGAEIDHIELFGPPSGPHADSRNFVLCPGKAYDRSPCGTGTSAKIACLAADGKLSEGQIWRQESVIGSIFEGSYRVERDQLIPSITGSAYVTGETQLFFDPADPFRAGIHS